MKILLTSDTYLPLIGGAEVHVDELMRRLRSAGHEVCLFVNQAGTTDHEDGIIRVPWKRNFFEVFSKLGKIFDEFKPDVVAAHYSHRLAMIAGVQARLRGVPMTVTLHGLGTLPEAHASWRPRLQNWLYRRISLACASRVIATSRDMLDAVPYVAAKATIIPNGADAKFFDPARWERDPEVLAMKERYRGRLVILTMRRLNPKCGIQYLVEAMPEIVKRRPDAVWLMVGTGRLDDQIRARVRELGLEGHVVMTGAVSNDQTPRWFAVADVVAFPSTAESTSISGIEAMLMGKAVVASRVGGLIELLGECGERGRLVKLVDWESSNYEAPDISEIPKERYAGLAETIVDLLDRPDERARLGEAAQRHARENYDWETVVRKTIDAYERARQALR